MGLSVYLATLFAVYGTKNASFKNNAEFAKIQRLVDRKTVAEKKGKDEKRKAIGAIRQERLSAVQRAGERYEELLKDPEFLKSYGKQEWVR